MMESNQPTKSIGIAMMEVEGDGLGGWALGVALQWAAAYRKSMTMTIKVRLLLHLCFAVLMAAGGVFIYSFHLFPLAFPTSPKPVAPLIGMASALLFVGCSGLSGLGLGIAIELIQGEVRIDNLPRNKIIDFLTGSQYLFLGLLLIALHFSLR